ncbi:MAG: antifreeze protein type I [Actinobacteria bacterium]|nr:antifreeze protein type I [Actinomycetota bacterium]
MAVIDRVKWDGPESHIAWKFPSQELSTWTQLIVNETQEAYVVSGGVYDGPFGAGRHTLTTENLPVIRSLMGLPFGGNSPFSAEVWFVKKDINLQFPWGTPDPIQLEDPKYRLMIPVRAFGQFWIQIEDTKRFLLTLVGTLPVFDQDAIERFFRGVLTTRIKQAIANSILREGVSVLEISTHLESLSSDLLQVLAPDFERYGIRLSQFNVRSVNVPEDDPAVITLKAALAKRAELGILNFTYEQDRSFDVLDTAAGNQGTAGGVIGAGLGLGIGVGIGGQVAQSMPGVAGVMNTAPAPAPVPVQESPESSSGSSPDKSEPSEIIRLLNEVSELRDKGMLDDQEFDALRKKILGGE